MKANRRALLPGLFLALMLLAGLSDSAVAERAQHLEGAFLVDVTPDPGGPPPFKLIRLLTRDGAVSGASPSLFGSNVSGEWIRTGNREFTVVNISFNYAPAGPVVSITKATVSLTLSGDGEQFDGRALSEVFDLNGTLLASFSASVHGTRIQVNP